MAKTAFLGLGVMGGPMAGWLARAGHDVVVFNRTAAKAEAWVDALEKAAAEGGGRGKAAASVADAVGGAEVVFACLGGDPDVRAIALGSEQGGGAFDAMAKGAIFVDHTTTSAQLARELSADATARGLHFIDAPVSGGQAGAENGQLAIMCGAEPAIYARAEPVMDAYAKACRLLGPVGSGQLAKMVNQICIAGLVQGLSEGLAFAEAAGLDGEAVVSAIANGAAGSWQMENRHKTMLADAFEFGFAVDWMRKDLGYCLDEARRNGAQLPVAALVDQFYAEVQAMGGGRWDTSSLIMRLRPPPA